MYTNFWEKACFYQVFLPAVVNIRVENPLTHRFRDYSGGRESDGGDGGGTIPIHSHTAVRPWTGSMASAHGNHHLVVGTR